ncbi:lisH domain-containing -like isoform X3 [Labeo rohita]|uniref:LisH domain-containing-like isoform X3 n=1 Tax=Labeo rohita TaxID=84645 RepID=A0A498LG01_LABRO|nr:lisH domain-containing -like isoform X3 [Labeo rohita]
MEELINTVQSDVVGRLAFKYMEMCKVDSSSDSESESNPRWSDVSSSKGRESGSTPEAPEKDLRFSGQNYQQCLDPYDGSSEDSGSSAKGSKKQRHGGFRMKGTGRRLALNPSSALRETRRDVTRTDAADLRRVDVQMRSSSDSELETPNQGFWPLCKALTGVKADLSDSGFNTRSSLNSPAVPSGTDACLHAGRRIQSGSPDSPAFHAAFSKRKFFPPSGDDGMQRKRQCISDMEVESVAL